MCHCIIIIYLLRIVLLHIYIYNISKYSVRRKMYLTEQARELKIKSISILIVVCYFI